MSSTLLYGEGHMKTDVTQRCPWARNDLSIRYHDEEWGVPQHDDRVLFVVKETRPHGGGRVLGRAD